MRLSLLLTCFLLLMLAPQATAQIPVAQIPVAQETSEPEPTAPEPTAPELSAPELSEQAVLQNLERAASQVRSIQCDFVQTKQLKVFAEKLVSKGRMLLEKPDKLRWEYLEPSRQGFVVNGERAMRWSEFSDEPERFAIEDDMATRIIAEQLLAWAGVDLPRLRKSFELEVAQTTPPVLSLTPLSDKLGQYLQRIRVSFGPDARSVRRVQIQEQDGDETLLEFENIKLNEPLPQGAFAM